MALRRKREYERCNGCIFSIFLSNLVAVEPGNQLLSPERKKNTSKGLSDGEVDSNAQSK